MGPELLEYSNVLKGVTVMRDSFPHHHFLRPVEMKGRSLEGHTGSTGFLASLKWLRLRLCKAGGSLVFLADE